MYEKQGKRYFLSVYGSVLYWVWTVAMVIFLFFPVIFHAFYTPSFNKQPAISPAREKTVVQVDLVSTSSKDSHLLCELWP